MTLPIKHINPIATRWHGVGKSIFSEMTQMSQQYNATNLGQGFPDFPGLLKF